MYSKKVFKIFSLMIIFTILLNSFSWLGNISVAESKSKDPTDIEFEITLNDEKSDPYVEDNGTYIHKVNTKFALDLWLNTPNANLTYCQINVAGNSNNTYYSKQDNVELNPALSELSKYIKLKLATFYFTILDRPTIKEKNNYSTISITGNGSVRRNKETIDKYVKPYNFAISAAPTKVNAWFYPWIEYKVAVGWTNEIKADVFDSTESTDNVCQKVNIVSNDENILKVFPDHTTRAMGPGKVGVTVSSALDPSVKTYFEVDVSRENHSTVEDITIKN